MQRLFTPNVVLEHDDFSFDLAVRSLEISNSMQPVCCR